MKLNYKSWLSVATLRSLIIYSLIFVILSFVANLWLTRNQQTGVAPEIVARDLNDQQIRLADGQIQAKPTLLYFFADWCPICKIQHPVISAINEDFDVLGVAMQSGDRANIIKYIKAQGIEFNVINDATGEISKSYGVNGVPAVFIIDEAGQIKFSTRGYATEAGLRSRIWLAKKD